MLNSSLKPCFELFARKIPTISNWILDFKIMAPKILSLSHCFRTAMKVYSQKIQCQENSRNLLEANFTIFCLILS